MLEGLKKTFHGAAFPKGSEQCTKTLTGKAAQLFLFKRLGVGGWGVLNFSIMPNITKHNSVKSIYTV